MTEYQGQIPVDGDGFYECNADNQLNFEIIQAALDQVMEQNTQNMEMLVYSAPNRQKANKAIKRWNESRDKYISRIKLVERRYLERNKE